MKFNIVGLEDSYGKHRFSNNTILNALNEQSVSNNDLKFIWWVEKVFLDPKYSKEATSLACTEWFGVMHVPLMSPNWAMYSQNDLAKIYFSDLWRNALKKCKGIIVLSEYMKCQIQSIYPDLKVFSLKHPVGESDRNFNYQSYLKHPSILLVGAWLRDFSGFVGLNIQGEIQKKVLLNHYAESFLDNQYDSYAPGILKKVEELECFGFLPDEEYDKLLCSSIVFIGLHETSANNALCECILYSIPFVAKRHPAIIEYCGEDYPLLVDSYDDLDLSNELIFDAHLYLKENQEFRESLTLNIFLEKFKGIYENIA